MQAITEGLICISSPFITINKEIIQTVIKQVCVCTHAYKWSTYVFIMLCFHFSFFFQSDLLPKLVKHQSLNSLEAEHNLRFRSDLLKKKVNLLVFYFSPCWYKKHINSLCVHKLLCTHNSGKNLPWNGKKNSLSLRFVHYLISPFINSNNKNWSLVFSSPLLILHAKIEQHSYTASLHFQMMKFQCLAVVRKVILKS